MKKVIRYLQCVLLVIAIAAFCAIYMFGFWASHKFWGDTGVGLYAGAIVFILLPAAIYLVLED